MRRLLELLPGRGADAVEAAPEHWATLYNVPLLIEESRLEPILAADRAGVDPSAFGFFMRETESDLDMRDGVAVIAIKGGLFNFKLLRIQKLLRQAAADSQVRAILLDIDSPGGTVQTTFDLTDEIFAARDEKPIWAIADHAFSAAYALGSAAHQLFVTRTGGVGSVGVIAVHVEFSKMDARMGLKVTEIISGARKKDFSDAEPLNPEARRLLQAEVDRLREIFVDTVARNRGLSAEAVRETEAGVYFGPNGVDIGFANGVATFDQVLEDLKASLATPHAGAAATQPDTSQESSMTEPIKGPEAGAGAQPAATPTPSPTAEPTPAAPAPANAPAQPAPAPTPGAQVLDLDAAREEGATAERDRASAIRTHCELAGCPERVGEFLESGLTAAEVGAKLIEARQAGAGEEIRGQHAGAASPEGPGIDTAAIYSRWNDPAARAAGAQKE